MDGWMDGCTYVHMYVCMYEWMDGWMDGWMYICTYVCMYEWMNGWMNGWMDGWMDVSYNEFLILCCLTLPTDVVPNDSFPLTPVHGLTLLVLK